MRNLVIVGGGFAGLWAALGAAHEVIENEADIRVTVVSKDRFLTMRPRLYESRPESLRVPLAPYLEPMDINFIEGTVTAIDVEEQMITMCTPNGAPSPLPYDQLVVATGSRLKSLPIPGLAENGFNIDDYQSAVGFDRHLTSILRQTEAPGHNAFVILGAGLTGIELATEMRNRIADLSDAATAEKARIVLVERAPVIGPDLGDRPRPEIEASLDQARVEVRTETLIERVSADTVTFNTGEQIATRSVVVTAGLQASPLATMLPVELDEMGRVPTDEMLRARGLKRLYVAGDIARAYVDDEHLALMSCQHAITMGNFAGYNAARELLGLPPKKYSQPDYVTCLDLGRSGALLTSGWERDVVMTGADAKQLKQQINTQWIYPPTGNRKTLMAAAHIDARPGQ